VRNVAENSAVVCRTRLGVARTTYVRQDDVGTSLTHSELGVTIDTGYSLNGRRKMTMTHNGG